MTGLRAAAARRAGRALAACDPRPTARYRRRLSAELAAWRAATRRWSAVPGRLRERRAAELGRLVAPPALAAAHADVVAAAQAPLEDPEAAREPERARALQAELRRAVGALEGQAAGEAERAHADAVRAIVRRTEDARIVAVDRVRGARTQFEAALAAIRPPRHLLDDHAAVRAALRDLARATDRAVRAGRGEDPAALRDALESRRTAGLALAAALAAALGRSGPSSQPY